MPTPYDPLTADVLVDATIGAVAYIVTSFSDSGDAVNETNFQTSAGAWRGRRLTSGERTATMEVEITNAAHATPAQFAVFSYRGQSWVIKTVGRSGSSSSPGTMSLSLGWIEAVA